MNKKLQVFVSSTYTDLIEERQVAVEAILDAGHIPAGMELFKAGKSQMKTIQKWIDESDVYMLILGGRYGSIEEESGLSYTELEYNYALSKNMPVFAVVLEDSFLFTKAASYSRDAIFEKDNVNKYEIFKKEVKANIVKFVKNIDQIPTVIHSQLNYFMDDTDYNLIGWVRSNYVNSDDFFDDFPFVQLDALMNAKKFNLSYIYENIHYNYEKIDAKSLFIKYYNKFCDGLRSYRWDCEDTRLYRLVVPFFVRIGVLKEEFIEDLDSRFKVAHLTPNGMKLYTIYSTELEK